MDECLMDLFALSLGGGVVAVSAAPTVTQNEGTSSPLRPDGKEEAPALTISHIVGGVWLLGMCGVLVWSGVAHMRLRRYLRRWAVVETRKEVCCRYAAQAQRLNLKHLPKLLVCPGLEVPMLTGLVAPVLMLPQDASPEDGLDYALLHELIHYRRRDIWLKALVMLTVSVHWFNPVMWLMVRQVDRDIELACDEAALTVLPEEERLAYGETILQAAARVHRQT